MSIFSQRFSELRSSANISYQVLSEKIGVSLRALKYYGSGEREPPMSVLIALSDYFGVTIDYLVGKSEFPDYSASEDVIPYPYFPIRLKALREEKGLDIFTVAEMVEEIPRNYAGYEEGEVMPRLQMICALADYFDVSLDYLVGRSDIPERR